MFHYHVTNSFVILYYFRFETTEFTEDMENDSNALSLCVSVVDIIIYIHFSMNLIKTATNLHSSAFICGFNFRMINLPELNTNDTDQTDFSRNWASVSSAQSVFYLMVF
jgi:hypothetical protein